MKGAHNLADKVQGTIEVEAKFMVILFSTSCGESEKRLLQVAKTAVTGITIRTCRSIESLSQELRQPRKDNNIVILLASSRAELNYLNLISLRDLLWDMKTIVILPDSSPDTVARGHLLRPRFVGYRDDDFSDVAAVLRQMIENLDTKRH